MEETTTAAAAPKSADRLTRILRIVIGVVVAAIVVAAGWVAYAYATTPEPIRHPVRTHYHFRLQIITDGTAVNFADAKYQTPLNSDVCTAALTKEPIHFHDNLDQFVHIHWDHITGGLLLKNYGWNFIGGTGRTLGYRFDQLPKILRIPTHGQVLPKPSVGDHYYIYTGDEHGYAVRNWDSFIKSDLRDFFDSQAKTTGWLGRLVPAAYAHQANETELAKLNDVLGSVVIFAQKTPPTDSQIKNRFAHLIDLPESTCGG